mmetsp:Transcript_19161/g.24794  ORF Transcript_19161/g.24794 Transcript_19161/m.24794 type:complete len:225 (-) Transcript_19161:19-693(-)
MVWPSTNVFSNLSLMKLKSFLLVAVIPFRETMASPTSNFVFTSSGADSEMLITIKDFKRTSIFRSRPMSSSFFKVISVSTVCPASACSAADLGPVSITRSTVKFNSSPTPTAPMASTTCATVGSGRPLIVCIWSPTLNFAFTSQVATSLLMRWTVMVLVVLDSISVRPNDLGFSTLMVSISVRLGASSSSARSSAMRATVSSMVVPRGWCLAMASSIREQSFKF